MNWTGSRHWRPPRDSGLLGNPRTLLVAAGMAVWVIIAPLPRAQFEARAYERQSRVLARAQRVMGTAEQPVRSLILRGTILAGFNAATGALMEPAMGLEIRLLLPDHYLNSQTRDSVVYKRGFQKDTGFFGSRNVRPVQPSTVAEYRADVTRLLVGLLGEINGPLVLTPTDIDNRRVNLTSKVDASFRGVLEIAAASDLPSRLQYPGTARYPERPITEQERLNGMSAPWKDVNTEISIEFQNFRPVAGLKLPHLVRKTANGRLLEEIRIERFEINPRLTPGDFAPR